MSVKNLCILNGKYQEASFKKVVDGRTSIEWKKERGREKVRTKYGHADECNNKCYEAKIKQEKNVLARDWKKSRQQLPCTLCLMKHKLTNPICITNALAISNENGWNSSFTSDGWLLKQRQHSNWCRHTYISYILYAKIKINSCGTCNEIFF